MNKTFKKITALSLCLLMLVSLTSCGKDYEKAYSNYIKSLIGINYLGATDDYIKATGANKADAEALYEANANMLADNIQAYYGVIITDAPELQEEYVALAKQIYSTINFSIKKVYEGTNSYYVDIEIYPIDIFNQTASEVEAYVDTFNQAVANGDYNDYTLSEYETIFSRGLIDILFEGSLVMTYAEPVVVTAEIIQDGDKYYISDSDFLAIDSALFNTKIK